MWRSVQKNWTSKWLGPSSLLPSTLTHSTSLHVWESFLKNSGWASFIFSTFVRSAECWDGLFLDSTGFYYAYTHLRCCVSFWEVIWTNLKLCCIFVDEIRSSGNSGCSRKVSMTFMSICRAILASRVWHLNNNFVANSALRIYLDFRLNK